MFTLCGPHSSNSLLGKPGLCQWLHLSASLHFKDIKVSSAQVCIQKGKSSDLQLLFLSVHLYLHYLLVPTQVSELVELHFATLHIASCCTQKACQRSLFSCTQQSQSEFMSSLSGCAESYDTIIDTLAPSIFFFFVYS